MSYLITKNAIDGLTKSLKSTVRATSTANINIASSVPSIDGITLNPGDRILLKNQTAPEENGIYDVISGNDIERSEDGKNGKISAGMMVVVEESTTSQNTIWKLDTYNPIVVGTTGLTFNQISGGGGNTTSIYSKTVWVSQGHERATDTRTGLDLFDRENPFETISAACSAIDLDAGTEFTILVSSGYYNEEVTLPAKDIELIGESDNVIISKIICANNNEYQIKNLQVKNDAATSVVPNEYALECTSACTLSLEEVTVSTIKDDSGGDASTIVLIAGSSLDIRNSKIIFNATHASAALTYYSAILRTGLGSLNIYNSTINTVVDVLDQFATNIYLSLPGTGTCHTYILNSSLYAEQTNATSTSNLACLANNNGVPTNPTALIENSTLELVAPSSNVVPIYFIALSDPSEAIIWNSRSCIFSSTTAGNTYISHDDSTYTTLRFLNSTLKSNTEYGRYSGSLTTLFTFQGVTGNGTLFPAIVVNNTSIYGKTVWVSQGHERATDTRTGLDLFDRENPFATISAACSALNISGDTYVTVFVAEGYYNEEITVPDTINISGLSENVFINRIIFNSGGANALFNCRMYNLSTFGSATPNQAAIEVTNNTVVRIINVYCEDYDTNVTTAVDPALKIVSGNVFMKDSTFSHYHYGAGTGTGITRSCVSISGVTSTLIAENCSFFCSTNTQTDNASSIYLTTTGANTLVRLLECQFQTAILHATATGNNRTINIETTTNACKVEVFGGNIGYQASVGASPTSQVLFRVNSTGISQQLNVTAITVREFSGSSTNRRTASASQANNLIRLIDLKWPYVSAIPSNVSGSGTVQHSGTMQGGIRFPQNKVILPIAGKNQVDGTQSTLFTDELFNFDGSSYTNNSVYEIKFCVTLVQSSTGLTGTAYLYDITNSSTVTGTTISITGAGSTNFTTYRSSALTVGSGAGNLRSSDTQYEVRITTDGLTGSDYTKLGKAWLEISNLVS